MRATVILKEGKSYRLRGVKQEYVFTYGKAEVLTSQQDIEMCEAIGVMKVTRDEDEPVEDAAERRGAHPPAPHPVGQQNKQPVGAKPAPTPKPVGAKPQPGGKPGPKPKPVGAKPQPGGKPGPKLPPADDVLPGEDDEPAGE